jgi:hypothetical protein
MKPALYAVPDIDTGDHGRGLSTLAQWELYVRGAGRSNGTGGGPFPLVDGGSDRLGFF